MLGALVHKMGNHGATSDWARQEIEENAAIICRFFFFY